MMTPRERITRAEALITEAQTLIDGLCAEARQTSAALNGQAGWPGKAATLELISDRLDDAREACGNIEYAPGVKPIPIVSILLAEALSAQQARKDARRARRNK